MLLDDMCFKSACYTGNVDEVKRYLKMADLHVNDFCGDNATGFTKAVKEGHLEVVRLLVADPRVNVNFVDNSQCSGLMYALWNSWHDMVELILTRKDLVIPGWGVPSDIFRGSLGRCKLRTLKLVLMDTRTTKKCLRWNNPHHHNWGEHNLIGEFILDPKGTRERLRAEERERTSKVAAKFFALTIFHCDGFTGLKEI